MNLMEHALFISEMVFSGLSPLSGFIPEKATSVINHKKYIYAGKNHQPLCPVDGP
jgi:hypothetical protein